MKPIFPPSAKCKLRNQENCEYIYTTNYSTLSIFPPKTSFIFLFYNYLQDKLRISDILLFLHSKNQNIMRRSRNLHPSLIFQVNVAIILMQVIDDRFILVFIMM